MEKLFPNIIFPVVSFNVIERCQPEYSAVSLAAVHWYGFSQGRPLTLFIITVCHGQASI